MEEWLSWYASLFVHRWDQYAVQQRNGSYWRVVEPLSLPLLAAHLAGRWTLGTYLLDGESTCSFAVFDADGGQGLEQLADLAEGLRDDGIPTTLEASRRGGHLWVHLLMPTPAIQVRQWLLPYAFKVNCELYPKQDVLVPGGSGSLIRLPLGVHQRSRCWYPFVYRSSSGELVPVGETKEECCTWLSHSVQRVTVPEYVQSAPSVQPMNTSETRMVATGITTAGRGTIRVWCRSYDIVEVIGRFALLDSRGVGSCPFREHHTHGDRRPSFQVFGGENAHWYCYTWGRAGDLFDFLCLYYDLSPQEGWQRLQAGNLL